MRRTTMSFAQHVTVLLIGLNLLLTCINTKDASTSSTSSSSSSSLTDSNNNNQNIKAHNHIPDDSFMSQYYYYSQLNNNNNYSPNLNPNSNIRVHIRFSSETGIVSPAVDRRFTDSSYSQLSPGTATTTTRSISTKSGHNKNDYDNNRFLENSVNLQQSTIESPIFIEQYISPSINHPSFQSSSLSSPPRLMRMSQQYIINSNNNNPSSSTSIDDRSNSAANNNNNNDNSENPNTITENEPSNNFNNDSNSSNSNDNISYDNNNNNNDYDDYYYDQQEQYSNSFSDYTDEELLENLANQAEIHNQYFIKTKPRDVVSEIETSSPSPSISLNPSPSSLPLLPYLQEHVSNSNDNNYIHNQSYINNNNITTTRKGQEDSIVVQQEQLNDEQVTSSTPTTTMFLQQQQHQSNEHQLAASSDQLKNSMHTKVNEDYYNNNNNDNHHHKHHNPSSSTIKQYTMNTISPSLPTIKPTIPFEDEPNYGLMMTPTEASNLIKDVTLKFGTTDSTSIPGMPGIDYPILDEIPYTSFECSKQRYKGFFADLETKCQAWHYCDFIDGHSTFLCPNGTLFSQTLLTCDWWFNVKCEESQQLYVLNERLYRYIKAPKLSFPEDYHGPQVDDWLLQQLQLGLLPKIKKKVKDKIVLQGNYT